MINLRKGLFTLALIFVTAITFAQVSITVNVPTAGGFSAALTAAGGDANTVANLTVTGKINATDIALMKAMPVLAVLDMENVQVTSNYFPDYAFQNKTSLTNIKLPSTITVIGLYSFSGCSGLTCTLVIPSTVTKISDWAFKDCAGLTGNLTIPNSVTSIGEYAFFNCSGLNGTLTLSNTLISIGQWAFRDCISLIGDLTIPNSVTSIGTFCFGNCNSLNGNLTLSNSITILGNSVFQNCTGLKGSINIPNTMTSIGNWVFDNCSGLNGSLTIPNSITQIGDGTFTGCSGLIGNLVIPESVKSIGKSAFNNCRNLTGSLMIPNSVNSIGDGAFMECNGFTGNLSIPNSITSIPIFAFQNCNNLKGMLTIPSSATSIGSFSFDCTGLQKITVNIITPLTIDQFVFKGVNKTTCELIVPKGSKAAYQAADYWKDFTNITESIMVIFNPQGGSTISDLNPTYNTTILEPTAPNRTGYTFAGWYKEPECINEWNFATDKVTDNITLYAKWDINSYWVKFDTQGRNVIFDIKVDYNSTITKPEDPEWEGVIFNGWYKDSNFNNLWNFATDRVASDMTLYAKWTLKTYTVQFDSQGGNTISNATVNHGEKVTEPASPTKVGYTFKNWYNDPNEGQTWIFDWYTVTQDTTLYAHWDINSYTITFDSKGGSAVASKTAEYNSMITAPSAPTRTGYTFYGWYKDEALTSIWNFNSDVVTDNATLYAKWDINKFIVSFDSNGGSNVSYIEVNYNSTLNRPADPTKTGYTFVGWFKDQALINEWNFSTDVVTNHMFLYAKWTINSYTVTFNTQGGSAISNVTANYNSTITVPSVPTRSGYTFDGWYKEAGCVNSWTFATDVVTSDITLYAKWNLSSDIETISGNSFKLYPNPAVSNLTIEGENIEEITIYSLIGAKVLQPVVTSKEAKCSFSIDVLESGIYFARIKTSENKIATIKFIKR